MVSLQRYKDRNGKTGEIERKEAVSETAKPPTPLLGEMKGAFFPRQESKTTNIETNQPQSSTKTDKKRCCKDNKTHGNFNYPRVGKPILPEAARRKMYLTHLSQIR